VTRHLCLSITLLDPLFHGRCDDDEPEWPPSPMRVFQALVAGSRAGCRQCTWSEKKAEAFRWLECRTAPRIIAPEARRANGYTFFVPNNDSDKKFERQERLTSKFVRPHIVATGRVADVGPTLHYLWPVADDEWETAHAHVETLCQEARYLMALGWGIDQAVGVGRTLAEDAVALLNGREWRAWDRVGAGRCKLRIPVPGSLKQLEQAHESFLGRLNRNQFCPPLKVSRFESVAYFSANVLPRRFHVAFEFPDGVAFGQEAANEVAAMVRSLACQLAKKDTHEFPGGSESFVAGHVNSAKLTPPRFSYLPLPTIGHRYADGMIRRVLIAEPFGGDGSHASWAESRLRNGLLKDIHGSERAVLLEPRSSSRGVIDRYVRESRTWTSVTPIVLPGFDDCEYEKAVRLCFDALRQANLSVKGVQELSLRKAPYWPGALHPAQYRRPDYLRHLPTWHLKLVFREPVAGPLSIGAGRHCGLGVMAATVES
jgi:CRISPR-associated protein Csb2